MNLIAAHCSMKEAATQGMVLIAPDRILTRWAASGRISLAALTFPSSSMAEQSAVNRWVVGSSPTSGAKNLFLDVVRINQFESRWDTSKLNILIGKCFRDL